MNGREAMRRAHALVSEMIQSHLDNAVEPDPDTPDGERVIAALEVLLLRHADRAQPAPTTPKEPSNEPCD